MEILALWCTAMLSVVTVIVVYRIKEESTLIAFASGASGLFGLGIGYYFKSSSGSAVKTDLLVKSNTT